MLTFIGRCLKKKPDERLAAAELLTMVQTISTQAHTHTLSLTQSRERTRTRTRTRMHTRTHRLTHAPAPTHALCRCYYEFGFWIFFWCFLRMNSFAEQRDPKWCCHSQKTCSARLSIMSLTVSLRLRAHVSVMSAKVQLSTVSASGVHLSIVSIVSLVSTKLRVRDMLTLRPLIIWVCCQEMPFHRWEKKHLWSNQNFL